jgi:hypothetical protein
MRQALPGGCDLHHLEPGQLDGADHCGGHEEARRVQPPQDLWRHHPGVRWG